jgi:nitrile hydratase beta subunit
MNGVHDMGGMQGFGAVAPELDEPRFHHGWERRAFALTLAMGASGAWNLDQSRHARESLSPARYLASTYYEIWLEGLVALMTERGLVTAEETATGRMAIAPRPIAQRLQAGNVAATLARGASTERTAAGAPRFAPGDAVRTRNVHPAGHTRLPRYCRGKPGTIVAMHGAHVYPDGNARGEGESPQWLYTVRFSARDLWGTDTTAAAVHVDCFEPYLESLS